MNQRRIVRALIAFVVMVTGVVGATRSASAVVPGRDGKIAFTRSNQVYTINASGSGIVKLTSSGKNYWPRWSPDGKRIAYLNETAAGVKNVWVMSANGANKQQVTRGGAVYGPAWSPDGRWIAFATVSQVNQASNLRRIRSTAPFGTPQTLTASNRNAEAGLIVTGTPVWSPDGLSIGFTAMDWAAEFSTIERLTLSNRVIDRLVSNNPDDGYGGVRHPAYSPSGELVAYDVDNPDYSDPEGNWLPPLPPVIEVINVASGERLPFPSFFEDQQPSFAPSGTRIALMNDAAGAPTIYVANIDGTGRRALTAGYQPDWQRLP